MSSRHWTSTLDCAILEKKSTTQPNSLRNRFMKENELLDLLHASNVSTSEWGKGNAKTIGHLLSEIESGETVLEKTAAGALVRQTSFLTIDVLHENADGKLKLYEEKQVFTDGRTRVRKHAASVQEKIKPGEDVKAAAKRALLEELGIDGDTDWDDNVQVSEETKDSPSYPTLTAHFTMYALTARIASAQFNPDGYKEVQPDKTTYFKWRRVS